jgi:hypothetical protein
MALSRIRKETDHWILGAWRKDENNNCPYGNLGTEQLITTRRSQSDDDNGDKIVNIYRRFLLISPWQGSFICTVWSTLTLKCLQQAS